MSCAGKKAAAVEVGSIYNALSELRDLCLNGPLAENSDSEIDQERTANGMLMILDLKRPTDRLRPVMLFYYER